MHASCHSALYWRPKKVLLSSSVVLKFFKALRAAKEPLGVLRISHNRDMTPTHVHRSCLGMCDMSKPVVNVSDTDLQKTPTGPKPANLGGARLILSRSLCICSIAVETRAPQAQSITCAALLHALSLSSSRTREVQRHVQFGTFPLLLIVLNRDDSTPYSHPFYGLFADLWYPDSNPG